MIGRRALLPTTSAMCWTDREVRALKLVRFLSKTDSVCERLDRRSRQSIVALSLLILRAGRRRVAPEPSDPDIRARHGTSVRQDTCVS